MQFLFFIRIMSYFAFAWSFFISLFPFPFSLPINAQSQDLRIPSLTTPLFRIHPRRPKTCQCHPRLRHLQILPGTKPPRQRNHQNHRIPHQPTSPRQSRHKQQEMLHKPKQEIRPPGLLHLCSWENELDQYFDSLRGCDIDFGNVYASVMAEEGETL